MQMHDTIEAVVTLSGCFCDTCLMRYLMKRTVWQLKKVSLQVLIATRHVVGLASVLRNMQVPSS